MFPSGRWNRNDWTPLERVQRRVRRDHDAAMRTMPRRLPQFPPQRNYPPVPNAELPPQRPAGRGSNDQPQGNNAPVLDTHGLPQAPVGRDGNIAWHFVPMEYPRPHTHGNRRPLPTTFLPPPPWPTADVPPIFVPTIPELQIRKEAKIFIYALHFFICLTWTDLSSSLNQYYARLPEKRPADFPEALDESFVIQHFNSLFIRAAPPFSIDMCCHAECMIVLKWRRLAANLYREYRPENESGPLPVGYVQGENRMAVLSFSQSQPVDMNEIRENEFDQLCVALRTWIGR